MATIITSYYYLIPLEFSPFVFLILSNLYSPTVVVSGPYRDCVSHRSITLANQTLAIVSAHITD